MIRSILAVPLLLILLSPVASAAGRFDDVAKLARRELPSLAGLYKQLHAHPELSFHEEKTSARVAEELRKAGCEVTEGVGGHGVVGVLKNGEGPVVMIRADMDALPIVEETGASYASKVRAANKKGGEVGVMHACGHDIHTTALVGTARVLASLRGRWSGTVLLVGQPAEERGAGARAMLKDGLFKRWPRPDYALAQHVDSSLEAGKVGYALGPRSAAINSVDITVRGVGGHAAFPQDTKDPIVIASRVVLALQTIVSREVDPTEAAVVTVGTFHGGSKRNVIPPEVKLELTVRTYKEEVRKKVLAAIERTVMGIAASAGVPKDRMPTVRFRGRGLPAGRNDIPLTLREVKALKEAFGDENVLEGKGSMGGDDFAYYGREGVPSFYPRLGSIQPKKVARYRRKGESLPGLHSPLFLPDPGRTIPAGVTQLSVMALDLLGF